MTTLLAVYRSSGAHSRCDARCHNAREAHCDCCCAGYYHGRAEDSAALQNAVRVHQDDLLRILAGQEARGELLVTFARAALGEKPIVASRGHRRTFQDTLKFHGG